MVQRAVAYVKQFGHDLGSVIATEDYRQELLGAVDLPKDAPPPIQISPGVQVQPAAPLGSRTSQAQSLRASFLFVQLPGNEGWIGFRDVLEVNGKRVDSRTKTQLEIAGESALDKWRRLSEESARYNLGSITRTANVPTFALLVLYPDNQARFSFTTSGEARTAGEPTCDVTFQETNSPTIIRSAVGADMPSSGTFRIEPTTGRVIRSELIAGSTKTGVASKSLVQVRARPQAAGMAAKGDARGIRRPLGRTTAVRGTLLELSTRRSHLHAATRLLRQLLLPTR